MRTEYQLTSKGKELRMIYGIIKEWALKWFSQEMETNSKKYSCCLFDVLPEIQSITDIVLTRDK